MRAASTLLLAVAACGSQTGQADRGAGARLEDAALAAGLIPAAGGQATGVWVRDTDRLCVSPPNARTSRHRVGLALDDGSGNRCLAAGTAVRRGDVLAMELGRCRIAVRLQGAEAVLPHEPSIACTSLCRGTAALSGVTLEQVSDSAAEAAALRLSDGRNPCAG